MIKKIEITGIHTDLDDDVKKYAQKKIGKLDSYMPRHARKSAHAEVKIKESKGQKKRETICEVTIFVPNQKITAQEQTVNTYAAIDIVEEKLKSQLRKYKEQSDLTKTRGNVKIRAMFGKVIGKKS
jgi:putative sigma-54 modulation protein